MRKSLIVDPQLILISVLNYTQRVFADAEVKIESALVRVIFEDRLSVLADLLFA